MKTLIIGHNGFVGTHLQRLMPIVSLGGDKRVDICNAEQLQSSLAEIQPEAIIHLAAQSNVPQAFKNPQQTYDVNFQGTFNLLQALDRINFRGKLLYISSGEVYGVTQPEMLPVKESYLLRPRNPYAVSKVAAEALCYQWSQEGRFEIVIVRPFNHIGPGQNISFSISNFAKQISDIKKGKSPLVIEVGDLDVTRDFTDVRDVARAYQLLLEHGVNGEIYNVCSGQERSLSSMLEKLLECAHIQPVIKASKERVRTVELRRNYGCCDKLIRETGWKPQIPLLTTLNDILKYWEKRE